jgi:type IV secretion system protein VirD4
MPNPEDLPRIASDPLSINSNGFVIGSKGGMLIRYATDTHLITIARTGGGKGRSSVIPNLLDHQGSIFSVEIEGESLRASSYYRSRILGQNIYVLDPFHSTDGYKRECINILDTIKPDSVTFTNDVSMLCSSINQTSTGQQSQDPYWTLMAGALLRALVTHVKTSPLIDDQERNLGKVASILAKFETSEWEDCLVRMLGETSIYRESLQAVSGYFYGENGAIRDPNTRSIKSTLDGYLAFARDAQLQRYSQSSTFDLSELGSKKCTIYLVMRDVSQFREYSTWIRLIVERAISLCPSLYNSKHSLPHNERILFMLDEFTQLGRLDSIDTGMQTCRHKGITLWPVFQDVSRLREVYGTETCESFLGAASCIQAFEIAERATTEFISTRAGKKVIYLEAPSMSTSSTTGVTNTRGSNESSTYGKASSFGSGESQSSSSGYGSSSCFSGSYPSSSSTSSFSSTVTNSVNSNDTYSSSDSYGSSSTESRSSSQTKQQSIQYTPHIVPALEQADVTRKISNGRDQLLILKDGRVIAAERANWDMVPMLRERVYGPALPSPPCFSIPPPTLERAMPLISINNSVFQGSGTQIPIHSSFDPPAVAPLALESHAIEFVGTDRKTYKLDLNSLWDHYRDIKGRNDLYRYRDHVYEHIESLSGHLKKEYLRIFRECYAKLLPYRNRYNELLTWNRDRNDKIIEAHGLLTNAVTSIEASLVVLNQNFESLSAFAEQAKDYILLLDEYKDRLAAYDQARVLWPNIEKQSQPPIEYLLSYHQVITSISRSPVSEWPLSSAIIEEIDSQMQSIKSSLNSVLLLARAFHSHDKERKDISADSLPSAGYFDYSLERLATRDVSSFRSEVASVHRSLEDETVLLKKLYQEEVNRSARIAQTFRDLTRVREHVLKVGSSVETAHDLAVSALSRITSSLLDDVQSIGRWSVWNK